MTTTFAIEFIRDGGELVRDAEGRAVGRMLLEGEQELFASPIDYWSKEDYERQWRVGLDRLFSKENAVSCLITSVEDPRILSHVFWWLLYRDGDELRVREQVMVAGSRPEGWDPSNPYDSIPKYEESSEISEWSVPMQSIDEFLRDFRLT